MRTWVAGELVTAAYMNTNIRDAGNFWLARPLCIMRQSVAQAITTGSWQAITFDTEDVDRDAAHSPSTNPGRFTAKTPGYYSMSYAVAIEANNVGWRGARIQLNATESSTTVLARSSMNAANPYDSALSGAGIIYMNGTTDYAQVIVYQDSTANRNTYIATQAVPRFQALWVST